MPGGPIVELYRAAQRLSSKELADFAFEWLRERLSFERGVIVSTYETHAAWVDAHFYGIPDPRALMESHAKIRHLDILTPRAFENPNVAQTIRSDDPRIAGPKFAPFRDHLERFDGAFCIQIVIPSQQHRTTTTLMVLRNDRPFPKNGLAIIDELAPHIVEATHVNRTLLLPRIVSGVTATALLDRDGRFLQTTSLFIELFWASSPPTTAFIAPEILATLEKRRPWPLPDKKHGLYGEPEPTGEWKLRIAKMSPLDELSARERQVATLFARGTSYKAIATKLGLSPVTVRNHLQNLYGKLGVSERSELQTLITTQ